MSSLEVDLTSQVPMYIVMIVYICIPKSNYIDSYLKTYDMKKEFADALPKYLCECRHLVIIIITIVLLLHDHELNEC